MGAVPARWFSPTLGRGDDSPIFEVRNVDSGRFPIGDEYSISLADLSNAETFKVAAAFGLNPKAYKRLEERQDAILAAYRADKPWNPINAHEKGGTGGTRESDDQEVPPMASKEPPKAASGLGALDEVLRTMIREESTNLDSVREYVESMRDEILAEAARPKVIRVSIPNRETKDLEGMTHEVLPDVLTAVMAGDPIMLVGPAGTGKSTIAEQCAESLGLEFSTMSVDPTMYRDVIFGFQNAMTGDYCRTAFRDAYEHGKLFCLDEMDNGTASVLGGLNQALSNGGCGFPDGYVKRHPDFRFVATANTYGTGPDAQYVGRTQLDAATLDRFNRITVGIDESLESQMAHAHWDNAVEVEKWIKRVRKVRAAVEANGLREIVSPRATLKGVRLLAAGMSTAKVEEAVLFAGMSTDTRKKVA